MVADIAAIVIGFALGFALQRLLRPVNGDVATTQLLLAIESMPAFVIGAGLNHMYKARANERPAEEAKNILKMTLVGLSGLTMVALIVQFERVSRFWVAAVGASILAMLLLERSVARRVFRKLRSTGRIRRRIVIVGTGEHAINLAQGYQTSAALGYEVAGFAGPFTEATHACAPVLGPIADLPEILERTGSSGVVVSLASVSGPDVNELTRRLTDDGYHVALSSSLEDIDERRLRTQQFDGRTMIYVEPVIRDGWRSTAKRAFDLVGATSILLVSLPVLAIAAIAIKLDSTGPVLFRQVRVGKDGERFEVLKLRTMTVDAEARRGELSHLNESDGPLFKISSDPRVTRVGRILRKLSIDELPQLVNVLRREMSLVGPRPALPEECGQWDAALFDRLRVPPGVTGLWQISGRAECSFEDYRRWDLYYVDNWTLRHDLNICAHTFKVVLTGRGAS